jgi:hypothetical protein
MEQYLRAFVNYQQDDWAQWLPIAEFASNNHVSETTGCSPFFGNYGFNPRMTFTQHPVQNGNDIREVNAKTLSHKMNEIFEQMKSEMGRAQAIQAEQANKHRREAVSITVGDRVWMDARNITTQRPSKKLDWKCLGPYEVVEVISPWAYRLQLPKDLHIHPVQPISRLSKVSEDSLPGQIESPPPPVIVEGEEEYEVEWVEDSRLFRRQLQYLVKWRGYEERSWEPAYIGKGELLSRLCRVTIEGRVTIEDYKIRNTGCMKGIRFRWKESGFDGRNQVCAVAL